MNRWRFSILTRMTAALALSAVCLWASSPGDEHWDRQFGPVGANNEAFALTVCSNKVDVLGSTLTAAGNTQVNFVAGFDGANWFPLNGGLTASLNSPMTGLGSDGVYVYAGGLFTNADNTGAQYNAKWDGANWSPLGDNTLSGPGFVYKRLGSNLYVGGVFSTAGTNTVNNIVCWNGANWIPLDGGVSGCTGQSCVSAVESIALQNGNVYVGGNFTSAGGVSASYVACYDGTAWHAMGNPFNGPVTALIFYGPYLCAGGLFTNTSLGLTNIARWDGASWSPLPGGGADGQVEDFATDGTNLYAGGLFQNIGGTPAAGVARFDGASWSALGTGLQSYAAPEVFKMSWQTNGLYVGGVFCVAGAAGATDVALWDGVNWQALGGQTSGGITYPTGGVNALQCYGSNVFAGGLFIAAGDVAAKNLAFWDRTNWHAFGTGVGGSLPGFRTFVDALGTLNLDPTHIDLYAGGNFTNVDAVSSQCIAHWDGTNWSALGQGVDSSVLALAGVDSLLYVGGEFTNAGGVYSPGLALWDGFNWYASSGGLSGANAAVYALACDQNTGNVYVGGIFTIAGVTAAANIAYYDGVNWSALGNGANGTVRALALNNGILYAGGAFTMAGTASASHVAQWDGTNWSALGTGINGPVYALTVLGTNLYACGNFTIAGGISASNIAKWNGSSWSALGSGLAKTAFALAAAGNDLFVGGGFAFAGDKPAQDISRWNDQLNFYPPAAMLLARPFWQTNRQFGFELGGTSGQSYIIQASADLKTWSPLTTNTAAFYNFLDSAAGNYPSRFYRAVIGP